MAKRKVVPFDVWKLGVDLVIRQRVGMDSDDGGDWPSRACYDAGISVEDAARVWAEAQDCRGLVELFGQDDVE